MSNGIDTSSERRKKEYRKLLDQAEILQEEEQTGLETLKIVDHIVEEANKLFEEGGVTDRVQHTDEILLDAKVIAAASGILYNVTEAVDVALDSYDPADIGGRIRKKYLTSNDENDFFDWSNIFKTASSIIQAPPMFSYLFGPVGSKITEPTIETRKKKLRPRDKKGEQAPTKQPEKLANVSREEDSVDDTVKFLNWAMLKEFDENRKQALNYMEFLFDPNSFTTTVENMFHMSFLIRDGRARIRYDDEGLLSLFPVSNAEYKRGKTESLPFKQSILTINMVEWQDVKKKLNVDVPYLTRWRTQWEEKKAQGHSCKI